MRKPAFKFNRRHLKKKRLPDTVRFIHTYRRMGLRTAAVRYWVMANGPVWLGGIDRWHRCRKHRRRIDAICLSDREIRYGRRDLIELSDEWVKKLRDKGH